MRRKTGLLKAAATESLTLSIELPNRPVETGRQQSVVLLAAHSFETLLEAIIYQERGRIRDKGDLYSYGLEKCINLCIDDLERLQPDDGTVLMALKQDRDAAAHDVVAMSDEMLWIHLRSAVDILPDDGCMRPLTHTIVRVTDRRWWSRSRSRQQRSPISSERRRPVWAASHQVRWAMHTRCPPARAGKRPRPGGRYWGQPC